MEGAVGQHEYFVQIDGLPCKRDLTLDHFPGGKHLCRELIMLPGQERQNVHEC